MFADLQRKANEIILIFMNKIFIKSVDASVVSVDTMQTISQNVSCFQQTTKCPIFCSLKLALPFSQNMHANQLLLCKLF